jgi:hypothetical protein
VKLPVVPGIPEIANFADKGFRQSIHEPVVQTQPESGATKGR